MSECRPARWRRAKYWLNALVLIAPVWFFYASLTPEFPPPWETQTVGPFSVTPTPHNSAPPYDHHGVRVKDFGFRFCDGCVERIRLAHANVGPQALPALEGGDGVVHGHGAQQEAHVPYPAQAGEGDRLWLTVQEWNGAIHRRAWPLPPAGPVAR
ncbi:MAG: hypothetical protein Q7J47_00435 [Azoarcus sp.]|nr:hypothetical protein [Azoarcus sp.]